MLRGYACRIKPKPAPLLAEATQLTRIVTRQGTFEQELELFPSRISNKRQDSPHRDRRAAAADRPGAH